MRTLAEQTAVSLGDALRRPGLIGRTEALAKWTVANVVLAPLMRTEAAPEFPQVLAQLKPAALEVLRWANAS